MNNNFPCGEENNKCNPCNKYLYVMGQPDNTATVAPGADVNFPQDGPNSATGITRISPSSFNLSEVGTYQVFLCSCY